jgi:hypothetical protein
MKKLPSEMTNSELRQYLSEHRNEEAIFSEALKVLLSRKKEALLGSVCEMYQYNTF